MKFKIILAHHEISEVSEDQFQEMFGSYHTVTKNQHFEVTDFNGHTGKIRILKIEVSTHNTLSLNVYCAVVDPK